ncbi:MAG: hypothetical protein Q9161_003450 [Pseudevernia consocians]
MVDDGNATASPPREPLPSVTEEKEEEEEENAHAPTRSEQAGEGEEEPRVGVDDERDNVTDIDEVEQVG